MPLTVAEICDKVGGTTDGDGGQQITGVAGLLDAVAGDLSFLANPKYAKALSGSDATAVLVEEDMTLEAKATLIRVDNPDKAFAIIAAHFAPPPVTFEPGVHDSAVIASDAQLGEAVHVGPHCVIEAGVVIGPRSVIGAGTYVGHGTTIGTDCLIYPNVSIRERSTIGDRVILHHGVVVGSDGFGYTVDENNVRTKIPQIGTVVIGNDVEIGANCAIDRARFGKTRIGHGVKIDNLVQVAHNVVVGDRAVIVAQAGVAGSSLIGKDAILAGQVGVAGHVVVGEGAVAGAQSGVHHDIPPKTVVFGYPAVEHTKAMRLHAHMLRLPDMKKKVSDLEKRIAKLEGDA